MIELVSGAVGAYLAANGALYLFQRRLVFVPIGEPGTPAAAGLPEMSRVRYSTADGLTLSAWYRPAAGALPTFVYFHGNAGHLGERAFKARFFVDRGYGFMLTSYRGYSGNPGSPTEAGIYRDARAALAFLAGSGVDAGKIVIYGESLGTGVAVEMARETTPAALVLEAPFTSLADVAAARFWWTPARWLVRDRFDSLAKIPAIGCPLLIVHGARDGTVPEKFGKRLFVAAPQPKEFHVLPEAGHADLFEHGAAGLVEDFLRRRLGAPA
jgi:uncharacterized protein